MGGSTVEGREQPISTVEGPTATWTLNKRDNIAWGLIVIAKTFVCTATRRY
jgi:hypothetical protein